MATPKLRPEGLGTPKERQKDGSTLEFINTKGKPKPRPKDLMSDEPRTVPDFMESQYKLNGETVKLDIARTANPVSMLGLLQGNTFKLIDEDADRVPIHGLFLKSNDVYEGGDYTDGPGGRHMQKNYPEQDPLQINDIAFSGVEGPPGPLTPVHELMHRGMQELQIAYPEKEAAKLIGKEAAAIMHHKSSAIQHVILEAMLESRGHRHVGEHKHRYRHESMLKPESVKKIYQSITPIFELSNNLLEERGYKPEEVMAELAEEEAGRMKRYGQDFEQPNLWNKLKTKLGFAIGGLATEEAPRSNSMSRQMEMALTGGSNEVDPVSGNEVPPGSLPEEVRDDIDARLSEGEYVVPADVVRYFGVKVFEDMRNEAKMGLSQMDADGRIGGEPVPATPTEGGMEGMQDITEEDLVALEQAMATGVADGGLMDKLATVAKSDKLINARMNAKGMSVGYAEGGAVQAPLNTDPTRVDALIDKFMIAAQNSPALMQELASRGVTLNTTGANMNPQEMQSANSQTERAFNTGGALGFTPSNYGLGFSVFGRGSGAGSSPVQEIETIMVEYYNPTTGDTMMIAHDKATNQPTQVVPAGYIIKPAGTGTPVTPVDPVKPENRDDDTRSASQKLLEESMKDTKWMERYDYSSPEGLYQTTKQAMEAELEAQHGIVQFISKFDKTGIMAKRPQLMILGQTNAHIRMLEKQGNTSAEEIKELKDLAAQYKEQHGLGGPLMGLVSNGWGLTDVIKDKYGDDLFNITGEAAMANASRKEAIRQANLDKQGVDKTQTRLAMGKASDKEKAQDKARADANKAAMVVAQKKRRDKNPSAPKSIAKSGTSKDVKALKESYTKAGGTWASGGRAKGGLMKKKKK
jgi:hypothetical protein